MSNFNKVILMGNLTRDIELKYTQGGMAIAKMGMAINRKQTNKSTGEVKEETCFVDLAAFGRTAEVLNEYCKRGSGLLVEGRLEYSSWEDKQSGAKRNKLEVVVDRFEFVGGRDGSPESTGDRRGGGRPAQVSQEAEPDYGDVPF